MNNSRSPSEITCLSDFNIDAFAPRSTQFVKLRRLFTTFQMQQTLTTPTRVTDHSSTCIDHLWTNRPDFYNKSGVITCNISDHSLVFLPGSLPNSLINTGTSRQDPSEMLMMKLSIETSKMLPVI